MGSQTVGHNLAIEQVTQQSHQVFKLKEESHISLIKPSEEDMLKVKTG